MANDHFFSNPKNPQKKKYSTEKRTQCQLENKKKKGKLKFKGIKSNSTVSYIKYINIIVYLFAFCFYCLIRLFCFLSIFIMFFFLIKIINLRFNKCTKETKCIESEYLLK